jgi:microcompartment protein CcmK/EutM
VDNLEGVRLLEAEIISYDGADETLSGPLTIVCDNIGAGIGESVFITTGSAVRDVVFSGNSPFKTVVTAIIDRIHIDEELMRDKNAFFIRGEE